MLSTITLPDLERQSADNLTTQVGEDVITFNGYTFTRTAMTEQERTELERAFGIEFRA